jgi:hypothetical protein
MSRRKPFISRAIGMLAVACATTAVVADEAKHPSARPPVRVYTNADLERVHPFVTETGVSSVPAVPAGESPSGEREPESRGQREAYWRREAAAVRERLRALEERAGGLRTRVAERERARDDTVYGSRKRSSSGSASVASLRASLAAVERRIAKTQDDLEERARRDGALPGWLR